MKLEVATLLKIGSFVGIFQRFRSQEENNDNAVQRFA